VNAVERSGEDQVVIRRQLLEAFIEVALEDQAAGFVEDEEGEDAFDHEIDEEEQEDTDNQEAEEDE
jgi:hypothetical protein